MSVTTKAPLSFFLTTKVHHIIVSWLMAMIGVALVGYSLTPILTDPSHSTTLILKTPSLWLSLLVIFISVALIRHHHQKRKHPLFTVDQTGIQFQGLSNALAWADITDFYVEVIAMPRGHIWLLCLHLRPDAPMTPPSLLNTNYSYSKKQHLLRCNISSKLKGDYTPESLVQCLRDYAQRPTN